MPKVPYSRLFIKEGREHGVDPVLLAAQIKQESGFQSHVCSHAGACGIAQFMPGTAKSWGVDRNSVESSLDGQARFMAALLKKFNGNESLALAGYNSGPNRVARLGRIPRIRETQNYVANILATKARWER